MSRNRIKILLTWNLIKNLEKMSVFRPQQNQISPVCILDNDLMNVIIVFNYLLFPYEGSVLITFR